MDIGFGDDIVWIRVFRNEVFVYVVLVEIDNVMFKDIWDDIECVFIRI